MTSPRQSPSPLETGPHRFTAEPGRPAGEAAVQHDLAHESPVSGGYPGPLPALPPASRSEAHRAMLAYLGVPFTLFVAPLAVYLASLRGRASAGRPPPGARSFAQAHAAQALEVSLTTLLYTVCGVIVGGVLALDSVDVALIVGVPLVVALWVSVLVVLIRAAAAASRAEWYAVPRWLRMKSAGVAGQDAAGSGPVSR
jgi:Domain of unknown function (DUF4870)